VAALSEAWVWGLPLAGIAGSNPAWKWMSLSLSLVVVVLKGRGLYVGLITRPNEHI